VVQEIRETIAAGMSENPHVQGRGNCSKKVFSGSDRELLKLSRSLYYAVF
jgi:hypothetical protein